MYMEQPCSCSNSLLISATGFGWMVSPFCRAMLSVSLTEARYFRYSILLILPPPRPAAFIWSHMLQRLQTFLGLTSFSCSRHCRLVIRRVCPL